MRFFTLFGLLLALGGGPPALAQSLAIHQAAALPGAAPSPANAVAGAIIPGSPLAALTGAAPAAQGDADADTPAPFGTSAIGMSVASAIGDEASRTFDEFLAAVRQSTQLTPVWEWLQSFGALPERRAHLADILLGLLITVLPGLVVEGLIHLVLARPRAAVVRHAVPQTMPPPDAQGLADAEAGETEKRPDRRHSLLVWGRKFLFGSGHFVLALLPLLGFALTLQGLISGGVLPARSAQLAIVGIVNGYLSCRVALEILRFLLAPRRASLRLIAMPDFRAAWCVTQAQVLLGTGFFAYVLVSVSEVLGLAHDSALVVIRLFALVIHIEVAIAIWQSRRLVGGWIAGHGEPKGFVGGLRRRLGETWHFFALFYVLALWIALAGGVHNAFGLLLRVVLVLLAGLVLGRLAWVGSSTLLERAFPDVSADAARHPALFARARAYNPLVRWLVRGLIALLGVVLVLQGWGLNAAGWLLTDPLSRSLIGAAVAIIITIAAALLLWECANIAINGRIERLSTSGRTRQASRLRTLLPMLKASIAVVLFLVAGYICLARIGVNTTGLLAISSVVGIAVGFGSQKLVQDIITGLFLLLEDAMQVGDVITLAGMTGTVERLSIRTIRLRGGDGSVNIIPFSAVTTVTNMTRDFGYAQISIEVGYEEDLTKVYAVLRDIAKTMRAEPAWGSMMRDELQIFGLDAFGASALVITGQIRTGPGQHWAVRREFYGRVKKRFEAERIEMPYTYLPPAPARLEPPAAAPAPDER